mmetsp:Transcript_69384/g.206681  ORF Transcript_69384/g.206681 Transcript_69384/m.206681 type:complete len:616 (-) Transcript_69384:21-1868(-)
MAPRRKPRRLAQAPKRKAKAPAPCKNTARESSGSSSYSGSSRSDSDCSGSSRSSDDQSSSGESASDEDDPRDYKRGGYHPVTPYQIYNGRYRVLSKLGAGAFSTVWLCADERSQNSDDGPELVAMKVCKSKKSVTEQALDEIALLERLQAPGSDRVVQMRGHFWHSGPNGRHKCMVFEVMGENLLTLVKHFDYNGLPVPMVKRITRHTLVGLAYIHSRGVIHTDVKLENVLVQRHDLQLMMQEGRKAHRAFTEQKSLVGGLSKSQKKRLKKKQKSAAAKEAEAGAAATDKAGDKAAEGEAQEEEADAEAAAEKAAAEACGRPVPPVRQRARLDSLTLDKVFAKLADFGNGCRADRKVTDDIQTRQYRSPEIIVGADWDVTADVWSAACMFFELLTGDFLFDPRSSKDWSRDEDHLALMIELLGSHPPKEWVMSGKYAKEFFLNSGKLKHIKKLKFWQLPEVLAEKYKMATAEAEEIADFLLPMLSWEPARRQSAAEALQHQWLKTPADGNGTGQCSFAEPAGAQLVAVPPPPPAPPAAAGEAVPPPPDSPPATDDEVPLPEPLPSLPTPPIEEAPRLVVDGLEPQEEVERWQAFLKRPSVGSWLRPRFGAKHRCS